MNSLNRLKSVGEYQNGVTNTGNQTYDYDRWGNRINLTANGTGINNTSFEIESGTNRIYAPGDLALSPTSRRIQYDTAGNQKQDTYTGAGTRTYDAENKLTSAAANNNQTATYVYDASGQRIKRTANGVETWQVYGFGGELLAEYPANGDKLTPQKEYGYRNGELLVTAEPSARTNVALAANGGVASASSSYACCGWNFAPAGANNGNRSGAGWGSGEGWNDNPPANTFPDWLQIDFNGSKTIDEIDVFTGQDNWQYPSEPTEAMTFSLYGLTGFDVQYWNGSSWTTVTGGSVTGNNKVWRKFTFVPVTTTKIRVLTNASVDGYSRLTEVEAWGYSASSSATIQWLVTDHLGTPRMIVDQTGTLANVKRHDYLPFGEELFAPAGGRSASLGYTIGDGVRQQFTLKERDVETGLDYFGARYYGSLLGRFTSADPLIASGRASLPQSWNRYAYALNSPLRLIDPDGLMEADSNEEEQKKRAQGQPRQTPSAAPSLPVGAPQTPTGVSVTVAVDANTMVNVPFGGSLFTGVGAILNLTPTDQNGNPIPNVTVIESVQPSETIQNPNPVTSPTGTVADLVGSGERHPASQPKTREQAGEIIIPRLDNPKTISQTHQMSIFSPTSGIMAIATHTRTLTNVDQNGNLVNNVRGNRKVNNYRLSDISPVTVIQTPMVMCPRIRF